MNRFLFLSASVSCLPALPRGWAKGQERVCRTRPRERLKNKGGRLEAIAWPGSLRVTIASSLARSNRRTRPSTAAQPTVRTRVLAMPTSRRAARPVRTVCSSLASGQGSRGPRGWVCGMDPGTVYGLDGGSGPSPALQPLNITR